MAASARIAIALAALVCGLGTGAEAAAGAIDVHRLLSSKNLWATVDVCNAPDQPDFVGIRGSMPGDGSARDSLYMSFRLQYLDASSGRWIFLQPASAGEFARVGTAISPRQGGRSFQLQPATGKPAFTIRGVVQFQWRHGRHVLASGSRVTTAGHTSLAGADPKGFSAASCQVG